MLRIAEKSALTSDSEQAMNHYLIITPNNPGSMTVNIWFLSHPLPTSPPSEPQICGIYSMLHKHSVEICACILQIPLPQQWRCSMKHLCLCSRGDIDVWFVYSRSWGSLLWVTCRFSLWVILNFSFVQSPLRFATSLIFIITRHFDCGESVCLTISATDWIH